VGNRVLLEPAICMFPETIVASFASLRTNVLRSCSALDRFHKAKTKAVLGQVGASQTEADYRLACDDA
jgi:hypothetical protein